MRKTVAIFFLIVFSLTFTECGQLIKLPLLVNHYLKHQQKGHSLTAFLLEHYATPDHNDADSQEDNQLPFKSAFAPVSVAMEIPIETELSLPVYPVQPRQKLIFLSHPLQQHLHRIFHPPRLA